MDRSRSSAAEVDPNFTNHIEGHVPENAVRILKCVRGEQVRRRILDSIAYPRLRSIFDAAVPGKREAIEWVESVYLETQRKVRPINQTNNRVQRSVAEITLALFTTTDLNAMGNASFLRFPIRQMALKHHHLYRYLTFPNARSHCLFDLSADRPLIQHLKAIIARLFLRGGRLTRRQVGELVALAL